MRPLFVYGSLCHEPLLDVVAGAPLAAPVADHLPDHMVHAAAEGPFPFITAQAGGAAKGLLLRDLTEVQRARIDFYEGGFDFRLVPVELASGQAAEVYMSHRDWTRAGPWHLETWVSRWAALSVEAAREVMESFGKTTAQEIAQAFPRIRARAQARLRARDSRHGEGMLHGQVDLVRRRSHDGFFALDTLRITHDTFSGRSSGPHDREVFIGPDASVVLPYDPVSDRVLVVEQLRMGPLGRGDKSPWQMEPVAGMIDAGETPEETAIREAHEEAGLTITRLEPVSEGYPSPGCSSEFHYIFVGLCHIPETGQALHGLAHEGEDIRTHVMSFDALMALAEDRRLANAPLALAAYWLSHHRARLRFA